MPQHHVIETKELFSVKPVFHLRIFWAKRIFLLSLVSQLEPSGTNWIKIKENFASREKIRKWKTGLKHATTPTPLLFYFTFYVYFTFRKVILNFSFLLK
jgi:hypothetical protein